MTLERRKLQYEFADGRTIIVHEANWDISVQRSVIESEARENKAKLNGSGNAALLYFHETIYPHLAACSSGEVPSLEGAFHLSKEELDGWYMAVREVNENWFVEDTGQAEQVEFRDGSTLTVIPANTPSVIMKLFVIEKNESDREIEQETASQATFRLLYYPKLAACTVGTVPTLAQAQDMPESELDKWYRAARRVNPQLFLPLEQLAEVNQQKAEEAQKKDSLRPSKL